VYVLLEFLQKIMAIPIMNPLLWFMIKVALYVYVTNKCYVSLWD